MAEINKTEILITPVVPKIVDNQQLTVYVPLGTGNSPGVLMPDSKDFVVDTDAKMSLKLDSFKDENGHTPSLDTILKNISDNIQFQLGKAGEYTLLKTDWIKKDTSYVKTVTINGFTAKDAIIFSPKTREDRTLLNRSDIFITTNSDIITFDATTLPTKDCAVFDTVDFNLSKKLNIYFLIYVFNKFLYYFFLFPF